MHLAQSFSMILYIFMTCVMRHTFLVHLRNFD